MLKNYEKKAFSPLDIDKNLIKNKEFILEKYIHFLARNLIKFPLENDQIRV
jgi:hypothetical protein